MTAYDPDHEHVKRRCFTFIKEAKHQREPTIYAVDTAHWLHE